MRGKAGGAASNQAAAQHASSLLTLDGPIAFEPDTGITAISKLNPLALDRVPKLRDCSRPRDHLSGLDFGEVLLSNIRSFRKLRLGNLEQSSGRHKLAAKYERFFA